MCRSGTERALAGERAQPGRSDRAGGAFKLDPRRSGPSLGGGAGSRGVAAAG